MKFEILSIILFFIRPEESLEQERIYKMKSRKNRVCYFGDRDITGAAAYLCGIMTSYGIAYDHVNGYDDSPFDLRDEVYSLYVLSDYRRERFRDGDLQYIAAAVQAGSGLVMFGGWSSFHGRYGEYHESPLADVLPVTMLDQDDRRYSSQGIIVTKYNNHPILENLPWTFPPDIVGYNEFIPKKESKVLLLGNRLNIQLMTGDEVEESASRESPPGECTERISCPTKLADKSVTLHPCGHFPLLVVGQYGKGRTAALATDVAPHWVGPMVEWGTERRVIRFDGQFLDIGNAYAEFFRNLLLWTGNFGDGKTPV